MPNWNIAQHHWHLRIDDGCGASELLAAVKRYRAWVDGGGISSNAYVMQPAKFFSDSNKPWQQQWELPKPIESAANVGVLSAVKWRPTDDESTTEGARASA